MATTSKSGSSRRKGEAPGKIKILMNGSSGKVVHSDSEDDIADDLIPEDLPEGTIIVEPQPVEDAPAKKKKEPIPGRVDTAVLDNVNCTACGRQLNPYKNSALHKHPQLKVVICKKCEKFLSSGEIVKDKDGIDEQCRWCGEGGRLVVCDDCSSAFCKTCVMRNFNRSEFNNINQQDSWKCYLCDKSQLQGMRENYRKIRDTLKALQAKQKAKEQLNGAKDKTSVGSTTASRSNGRKADEPCSSSEAQPHRNSGPRTAVSDASGAVSDRSLALTLEDLAVDHMYIDVIMDKLSTSTNTFKEMLRALRSQFHSTSPRAADEAPPMFQFSFSAAMDINTKKQKCAKALNKGLITYLQSLKKILHKGQNEDRSRVLPTQVIKDTEPVTVTERPGKVSTPKQQEATANSTQSKRTSQSSENNAAVKEVERDKNEKSKTPEKTPEKKETSKSSENKKETPKSVASNSKVKPKPDKEKDVQPKNKNTENKKVAAAPSTSNGSEKTEDTQRDFNIDEENVAARLDLIQELAEEMLKDNASDEDNETSQKENESEDEGGNEEIENCKNEERGKRKQSEDSTENIPSKKKKTDTEKDVDKSSTQNDQDRTKEKEVDSSDEEKEGPESKTKATEEMESSSSDPLSSDEEPSKVSRSRKKKKKASSQTEEAAKPKAKNESSKGKKEKASKLQLSKKMLSKTLNSVKKKEKENTEKGEKDEKSSLDKEIDRFSKLPTIQKRKKQSDEEEIGDDKEKKKAKTQQKSKPGPKSSKKGIDLEDLSSDAEDKGGGDDDVDESSNEEDDLEPKVTFFLEKPEEEEEQGGAEENENEMAKKLLLEESDEGDQDDEDKSSDSSSDMSEDSEAPKKKDKNKGSKKNEDDKATSDQESEHGDDSEDNIGKKSKRIRSKLLDTKLTDTESDEEKKKKKKDEDYTKEDSSGSSIDSDLSDNDKESDSDEEDSEEDDEEKKSKKKGKKRKRKGKRKGKKKGGSDEDEDENEEEEGGKKGKSKKRKRIKKMSNSSDEDGNDEDKSDDDEANSSKYGKRKKIRKVMSNKKLEDSTRAAAKAEEKRRKRIAAKQREFNIETITDDNNPMNCPITTKLVLENGKEEEDEPLVQVNKKLIRKLKPHQVEAVQFLWDCMFESVKRSKKEQGAGCILAHCMGLGKTLSVISFVHTILSHEKSLKMRTCLVVSPLNTVLNWKNEWTMWLDKKDQLEVWELASCKQNVARAEVLREWQESGGIMIMGYEMYRNLTISARVKNKRQKKTFQETLVDPGPDLVVCDEGHILKNETSAVSKAMNQMKTRRRVVLTGTPLQNNLNEYHCMVSFVKPNLLGTRKEFNNRFISPIQNGQCTDSTPRDVKIMKARAHVLHEMLAGCVQRRDYSALTKFLPPKQEYVISVRLTDVQIELYEKYLCLTGQGVDGIFNNKGARLFKDYQSLMKIWTHPWVLRLAEIRDELKMKFDDEDSFIDDESEEDRSFSSSESDSDDDKKFNSDSGGEGMSLGPHSKRGTRRTRAKARRQAGEESDPEEVIAEWKTKSRLMDDEAGKSSEPDKTISNEWWAQFVCEDDQNKLDLSNKLTLLFEILRMCEEIGDKVLIFSQSILSLNIIENFLETIDSKFQSEMDQKPKDEEIKEEQTFGKSWTKNLDYYRMDGSTSAQNRQMWAQNFNDVENYRARLFLISTKAGGLGINLVAANRVIIFDASWNPSHDVQSIFRVYRFGQTKPCYIYRFLAQGTMEEKIYERQVTKLSLSQRVVDEHQIERHFSANDLKELYTFHAERWEEESEMPTLALPKDPLLAEILKTHRKCVVSFHEHDSLLENQIEQTLTEEEKKAAWEEYENEKKGIIIRGPGMDSMGRTASWPMMAAAQILSREQITATVQALRLELPDLPEEMFHLHVQQALRRQVQMKQEEMRRMELLRMQEMTYLNMMSEAERSGGMSHGMHSMQNLQNMAPWMQMQRLRAMQNHYMQQNLGGAYAGMRGMSTPMSNNPDEPIDLDESPTK